MKSFTPVSRSAYAKFNNCDRQNIMYVSKGYESLYFTLIKNWSIYILVKNKKQGDLTKELGRSNHPFGIVDNNTQLHYHFRIQSPLPSRQLFEVSRTFPRRIYPAWARGVLYEASWRLTYLRASSWFWFSPGSKCWMDRYDMCTVNARL